MAGIDSAWRFETMLQDRCAACTEPFENGTALFRPDRPRVYDENFLRIERGFEELEARRLAETADRLQGGAGLTHRKVVVPDERAGRRLSDAFAGLRWRRSVLLTMEHRGRAPREPDHRVVPAQAHELRAARTRAFAQDMGGGAAGQVARHLELLSSVVSTRAFAVVAGGELASWCVLYEEDGVGQVEDVMTVAHQRRRGFGRAVVQAAARASVEGGNRLTFIVADDEDWPKRLYASLGFQPLGRRYEYTRT